MEILNNEELEWPNRKAKGELERASHACHSPWSRHLQISDAYRGSSGTTRIEFTTVVLIALEKVESGGIDPPEGVTSASLWTNQRSLEETRRSSALDILT